MSIVTEAYFVRHGQSEANRTGCAAGWSDTPLSPLGRQQAMAAAELFAGIRIDRAFSSDLPRALETCRLVLPHHTPQLRAGLREVSVGSISGRPTADIKAENPELYERARKHQDYSCYGGESDSQVRERIKRFVEGELNTLPVGSKVAVVGHEGTVLHMLGYVLGCTVLVEKLQISNAAVFKFVRTDGGGWKVAKWNHTGSLD